MYNPLQAWFRHREEMQRLRTVEAAAPFQALIAVTQQQNAVMMEWLAGFKSTAIPKTTTLRDADEFNAEQDRERLQTMDTQWEKLDINFPPI
jgi:hypothetical protein